MPVENAETVDIISTDRVTGDLILTITDHLNWSDSLSHQVLLQRKLNRYLAFVESGEISKIHPDARSKRIVFKIVFQFPPDEDGKAFLTQVRPIIESAGFHLREEIFSTGPFN